MKTLAERVQSILDDHPELEQLELAKIAGVTKGTVNQWRDGKIKSMKLEYAAGIQKRLGYSAVWLVLGEGERKIGAPADVRLTTPGATSVGAFNLDSAPTEEGVKRSDTANADELKKEITRAVADESLSNETLTAITWVIRAGKRSSARGDQHHETTVKLKNGRAPAKGRTGSG